MEDTAIIRLFQERSQQAIAELSQKYGKLCQSLSRRILNNEEDAKECVNDTWLGVWNSIPPQTPNPLVSYVCRITRNLSVKRLRHNMAAKRNSYYDVSLAELEECIPAAQEQEPWEEQEVTKVLERFLRELDTGSRVMFVKRYWLSADRKCTRNAGESAPLLCRSFPNGIRVSFHPCPPRSQILSVSSPPSPFPGQPRPPSALPRPRSRNRRRSRLRSSTLSLRTSTSTRTRRPSTIS